MSEYQNMDVSRQNKYNICLCDKSVVFNVKYQHTNNKTPMPIFGKC